MISRKTINCLLNPNYNLII